MKLLLAVLVIFSSARCTPTIVYVCDSPKATRYHLKQDCRGLSNCSHRIIKMTLEEAVKNHKTLCHWER